MRAFAGAPHTLLGRRHALTALSLLAAFGLGGLSAYSSFRVHPLALPIALALIALVSASIARPEVGVAAVFVLIPIGSIGLTEYFADWTIAEEPVPPWLPVSAWCVFLVAIAAWSASVQRPRHLPLLLLPVLLLLAVSTIGLTAAVDKEAALPAFRSLVTGLLLLFAITSLVRSRAHVFWVLGGVSLTAAVIGTYAVYQHLAGTGDEGFFTSGGTLVTRVAGGFGHPNQLAGFLVLLVPFSIAGAVLSSRTRLIHWAGLALAVLGIYFTFSRSALVALAVVPFLFLGRRFFVAAPVLVLLLAVLTPGLIGERFSSLSLQTAETGTRLSIWRTSTTIWAEHPLVGVGPGGFPQAYAEAPTPGKQYLPGTALEAPPHAHNLFLHVLAEQGLVGLLALLGVLFLVLLRTRRLQRSPDEWRKMIGTAGIAFLVAFLIHNQFDVTLLETTSLVFWGLIGLLYAVSTTDYRGQRMKPHAPGSMLTTRLAP